MKIKTSELTGDALVAAVAMCEGYTDLHKIEGRWPHEYQFAMWPPRREYGVMELWEIGSDRDWAFFGPIIEREEISISREFASSRVEWAAWTPAPIRDDAEAFGYGPTPLIAAMRCYVASKLGDEVEIPEGLK